ncbi:glycoside hydrolase family 3 C-terminal domain-containing protein [Cellulomonas chengniuliangii]|uniref:glycoside hydrolase family 3 C-terminal domain-containing protein n=1 Tax=Cellulomonas chengniuliangii TaxID=2968084 RepID=UPI001D0DF385|nr:glycoside hydrolase family 3 C-terminal domain-containing protein [Cellulomonas chengniuliangii]MCC2316528.1 glycoside hydrolase family 3 C-terminal domain-containing protein [Cellulomonas chengniuliangii]
MEPRLSHVTAAPPAQPHPQRGRPARRLLAALLSVVVLVTGLSAVATSAAAQDEPPWMNTDLTPDERADLLAEAMTLDQKLTLFEGSGSGATAIPELGIPARREIDGASGVVIADAPTTAFPAGYAVASTWNPDLAQAFGRQAGLETHLTGFSGWAAPSTDLVRTPFFGRQFASYGEDPLLGGLMPAAVTTGVNQTNDTNGVYSLPKHYVANNQETQRTTLNAVLDERTLRETYIRQWEILIQAEPGAVMCAFPRVNGTHACENPHLLFDILKGELGYPGWVSSDFNACTTIEAYNLGADVCGPAFPDFATFTAAVEDGTIAPERFENMVHRILRTYFKDGIIDNPPVGSLENPKPATPPLPDDVIAESDQTAYDIAVDGSVLLRNEGQALPLAADDLDSIAVIGEAADRYISGFGSDIVVDPTQVTTMVDGITARAGAGVEVTHVDGADPVRPADLMPGDQPVPSGVLQPSTGDGDGLWAEWFTNSDFSGDPNTSRVEDQVNWGEGLAAVFGGFGYNPTPAPKLPDAFLATPNPSVRWTGTLNPTESGSYQLGLTVLGQVTLWVDDQVVLTADADTIQTVAADLALTAGQSYDIRIDYVADAPNQCCPATSSSIGPAIRLSWVPPSGQASPQIQEAVEAAAAADVAVVIANDYMGESLDRGHLNLFQNMDLLIEAVSEVNPNTVVVLATGAPVELPWLDSVPAVLEAWYPGQAQGRAVAALLFGDEDFSGHLPISWPATEEQVTEGLGLANPYYDVNVPNIDVDYTDGVFVGYRAYGELGIEPLYPFGHGLSYTSFEYSELEVQGPRARQNEGPDTSEPGLVRVQVTNTGTSTGTEVVQVYNGRLPTDRAETPPQALLGWDLVTLEPGESATVEVPIELYTPEHVLAYWDTEFGYWITPTGTTDLYVGPSSGDIRLASTLEVREPLAPDTTPPNFELTGLTDGGIYGVGGTIDWGLTIDDPTATVVATLDGAPLDLAVPLELWTLDLGQHTVVVTATDPAGNSTTTTYRFYLKTSLRDMDIMLRNFEASGVVDPVDVVALRNTLFSVRALEARGNDAGAVAQLRQMRTQVLGLNLDEAPEAALLRSIDAMIVELGGTPPGAGAAARAQLDNLAVVPEEEADLLRE